MPTSLENICGFEGVLCLEVTSGPLMQNTPKQCFVTATCLSSQSLERHCPSSSSATTAPAWLQSCPSCLPHVQQSTTSACFVFLKREGFKQRAKPAFCSPLVIYDCLKLKLKIWKWNISYNLIICIIWFHILSFPKSLTDVSMLMFQAYLTDGLLPMWWQLGWYFSCLVTLNLKICLNLHKNRRPRITATMET